MTKIRYWIGVASREHVMRGVKGGFAQVCHGKQSPLQRMQPGDWLIYYSPTEKFGQPGICRKFTAIGIITSEKPYQFQMSPDFVPWRISVNFLSSYEVAIEPLLDKLVFVKDRQRWGLPFRRGLFEISKEDFHTISSSMSITHE